MIVEPNFPTKKKSRKRKDRTGKYYLELSDAKNQINPAELQGKFKALT